MAKLLMEGEADADVDAEGAAEDEVNKGPVTAGTSETTWAGGAL